MFILDINSVCPKNIAIICEEMMSAYVSLMFTT